MTQENILSQIKNNLEWLEIDTSGKTWQDVLDELNGEKIDITHNLSMAMETILLIKLFLNKEGEEKNDD